MSWCNDNLDFNCRYLLVLVCMYLLPTCTLNEPTFLSYMYVPTCTLNVHYCTLNVGTYFLSLCMYLLVCKVPTLNK